MYLMDYIQMGMLIIVIPALIIFLIRYRRNEINKIPPMVKDFLKSAKPKPLQADERAKLALYSDAELVMQPAFVHYTSSLSTIYGNRTAYLVYYDRKKERLRAQTIAINKFEKENDSLQAGDYVLVVIEKRKHYLQCVSILQKL